MIRLPEFYNQKDVGAIDVVAKNNNEASTPFEPKKYEDLLATAVINKVIDAFSIDFRSVFGLRASLSASWSRACSRPQMNLTFFANFYRLILQFWNRVTVNVSCHYHLSIDSTTTTSLPAYLFDFMLHITIIIFDEILSFLWQT